MQINNNIMGRTDTNTILIDTLNEDYEKGFRMIFIEFYKPMFRVASRFIDENFAEDVIQDIFITIYDQKILFPNPPAMKSYLFGSVQNKCLNVIRKNNNQAKYVLQINDDDLRDFIMEEDLMMNLYNAIDLLPENYRTAIQLSLDGLSIANIAKQMRTSEDAVKAYKRRGKDLLKKSKRELSYIFSFL